MLPRKEALSVIMQKTTNYSTTLCAKISTSNGMIKLLNESEEVARTIESRILLGVAAGDITYQLRT